MGSKKKERIVPDGQEGKGGWSQKGIHGGFAFHRRETKLVHSTIKGKENVSIIDYCPLLLRPCVIT